MATALSSFRDELRPDVPMCPPGMLDKANLHAIREICEKALVWRYDLDAQSVTTGTASYNLNPPANSEVVHVFRLVVDESVARQKTELWLDQHHGSTVWRTKTATRPKWFYAGPGLESVRLVYTPSEDVADGLKVYVALKPDRSATSVEDVFYTHFEDAVGYGARTYLFGMKVQPWFDASAKAYYKREFMDALGDIKVKWAGGFGALGTVEQ